MGGVEYQDHEALKDRVATQYIQQEGVDVKIERSLSKKQLLKPKQVPSTIKRYSNPKGLAMRIGFRAWIAWFDRRTGWEQDTLNLGKDDALLKEKRSFED